MNNIKLLETITKTLVEKHFEDFLMTGQGDKVFVNIEADICKSWKILGQSDTWVNAGCDVSLNGCWTSIVVQLVFADKSSRHIHITSKKLPDGHWSHSTRELAA